jgi:hypothetical protein
MKVPHLKKQILPHLKKLLRKPKPQSSTFENPPSYEEAQPAQIEYFFKQQAQHDISGASIPQWLWITEQCRVWFFSFMIAKFGYEPARAACVAARLEGFGASMFLATQEQWSKLVGPENGAGLEAVLIGWSDKRGGVPSIVGIKHSPGLCDIRDVKK